ncbi:unnamed protein product [Gordionus sp. m RMFG-2023]
MTHIAAYLRLHSPIYTDLSGEEMSTGIAFLLMIMTITFCTAALIGVKAYLEHSPDSFKNYYVALTTLVFSQILIILIILAFANKIKKLIGRDLEVIVKQKYGKPTEKSVIKSIDFIQSTYKCCGANDYQDYADSFYLWTLPEKDKFETRFLPRSCCVDPSDVDCNRITILREFNNFYWEVVSNYIFTKGCLNQLQNIFVDESLAYMVGNFIAIFIMQIIAIYFAFSMESKLYEEMGSKMNQSQEMKTMSNQLQFANPADRKTILAKMIASPFSTKSSTMSVNNAISAPTPQQTTIPIITTAPIVMTNSSLMPNQNITLTQASAPSIISTPIIFENVPLGQLINIENESKLSPVKQTSLSVKGTPGLPTIPEDLPKENVYTTSSLVQRLMDKTSSSKIQNDDSNKLVGLRDDKPKSAKSLNEDDDYYYLRDIS